LVSGMQRRERALRASESNVRQRQIECSMMKEMLGQSNT